MIAVISTMVVDIVRSFNHSSIVFDDGSSSTVTARMYRYREDAGLLRAKTLLGACFKLSEEKRAVFMRILMLFSLHVADDDSKQLALCVTSRLFCEPLLLAK